MTSITVVLFLAITAGIGLQAGEHVMTPGRCRPDGTGARRARASLSWLSGPSDLDRPGHHACKTGQARIFPAAAAAGDLGPYAALS